VRRIEARGTESQANRIIVDLDRLPSESVYNTNSVDFWKNVMRRLNQPQYEYERQVHELLILRGDTIVEQITLP
jgi:ribosomal protein L18E